MNSPHPLILLALCATALLVALALPAAVREKSWLRFFIGMGLSLVGLLLPLFVFFLSAVLTPDWKGECRHGWLDCFHSGKLALTPLVLWASAALYALEVYRVAQPTSRWIVLGVALGAVVSALCLVFGLIYARSAEAGLMGWLLVPFYVSVWYAARAIQLMGASGLKPAAYVSALGGSLPFWIASILLSRYTYQTLPDEPPSCFVVTAAGRGHRRFVGPFVEVVRQGRKQEANGQLVTLMRFEAAWQARAPRSHQAFRRLYNRWAPAVARRIISPWTADLVYLLIKPAELVAGLALRIESGWERRPHMVKEDPCSSGSAHPISPHRTAHRPSACLPQPDSWGGKVHP